MKLNVGDKYTLSNKLQKAFEVEENICKIISISNSITTLQVNSEVYSVKTETALENLSISYSPKANLSEDSPKRKKNKNEKINSQNDNLIKPKPDSIETEEISISEPLFAPELPASIPKPAEVVTPSIPEPAEVVTPSIPEPEQKTIIIPENNNNILSPLQDNDEPENPDDGFF